VRSGRARGRRGWRAAAPLLLALALLGAPTLAPAATAAPAGGSASISDSSPQPGQTITVHASGLQPGKDAVIDYVPDAVRFGVYTVTADGTVDQSVRIPANTYDGPKEIVVTSFDSNGRFTRLKIDFEMAGPPASVSLNDTTLVPGQRIRFDGDRWFAGSTYAIVLFPERVTVATGTIGSDRTLDVSARMPDTLLNGKHGFLVGGRAAGGKAAYFKLFATVTGGIGQVPKGDVFAGADELNPTTSTTPSSSSSSSSTTRVTLSPEATGDLDGGGFGSLLLVILGILLLLGLASTWFLTSDGRAWLRKRRERVEQRRRERQRRRGAI
jgi:hypothetical protein